MVMRCAGLLFAGLLFLFLGVSRGASFDETRQAAAHGDAAAQSNLGVMYVEGRGVVRNDVEAVKWYRKAADQGYARAQINLGMMYRKGKGVVRDDVEAVRWYRKAAEQGDAEAQTILGLIYVEG